MLSKSKWEKLSEKAQWDIKVALRGPDSNYGETVKWFTASVIRGQMSDIFRVGGLVNLDLQLVVLPYGRSDKVDRVFSGLERYGWNYQHFCDHVRTAAEWLDIPILSVESDLWHKVMQYDGATRAAEEFLDAAEAWKTKWADGGSEKQKEKLYSMGLTSPGRLYSTEGVAELERHLREGRIRF